MKGESSPSRLLWYDEVSWVHGLYLYRVIFRTPLRANDVGLKADTHEKALMAREGVRGLMGLFICQLDFWIPLRVSQWFWNESGRSHHEASCDMSRVRGVGGLRFCHIHHSGRRGEQIAILPR